MLVRGSSDLSALRQRIPIPMTLAGRWAAARRAVHAVAGFAPVPMELVLWIPVGECGTLASWTSLASVIGDEGPPMTITLQVEAARAVLGPRVLGHLIEGMYLRVTGPRYPAAVFEGGGFTDGRAIRIDGGLLVGLTSTA